MKKPVCPYNYMEANLGLSRGDADCLLFKNTRDGMMTDGKTAYSGQDYPVHSNAPWRIEGKNVKTAISSGCKHIAMVNYFDCGIGDPRSISKEEHEANAKLIAAAPEMLEVLRWLDAEMDCRDDEFGGCLFSRGDFDKVRRAIKTAMEG